MRFKSGLPIGELFMFGFEGKTLPPSIQDLIRDYALGGLIYFARNIESKDQLRELSREAKALNPDMLIAIDQEGGRVRRLRPPEFTDIPSGREMAKLSREDPCAFDALVTTMAREMREVGITLDFAPILDLDTHPLNPIIGDRAFSADPEFAGEVANRFIEIFEKEGLLSCGKHFPGHGDTDLDSHLALPTVAHPIEVLRNREWIPFKRTIDRGLPLIMTAHIQFPEIDPHYPATLSPIFLKKILREELKFNGLIITDDMQMKGIADHYDLTEASLLSLKAGADIILICAPFGGEEALLLEIDRAIVNGELSRVDIERGLARIRDVKKMAIRQITPSPPA